MRSRRPRRLHGLHRALQDLLALLPFPSDGGKPFHPLRRHGPLLGQVHGPLQEKHIVGLRIVDYREPPVVGTVKVTLAETDIVAGLHMAVRVYVDEVVALIDLEHAGENNPLSGLNGYDPSHGLTHAA
jgi:hypothetical protein